MTMYEHIEELMKKHGETAAELSRATGISNPILSQMKKRNGGLSYQNAMLIAKHYGVPVESLYE